MEKTHIEVSIEWIEGLIKVQSDFEKAVEQFWKDENGSTLVMKAAMLSGYAKSANTILRLNTKTEKVIDATGNPSC